MVPGVRAVAPLRVAELPAEAGGRTAAVIALGTTPAYRDATRLEVAAGRFLADLDVADRKRVAVIGAAVARALFPLGKTVGERVRLGGDWYQVVGVLEGRASPRGRGAAIRGRDVNRSVLVPLGAQGRIEWPAGTPRAKAPGRVSYRCRPTASAWPSSSTRSSGTLGFKQWPSFLKNNHLTAASIDRLTETSHVFNMKGSRSLRKNLEESAEDS